MKQELEWEGWRRWSDEEMRRRPDAPTEPDAPALGGLIDTLAAGVERLGEEEASEA